MEILCFFAGILYANTQHIYTLCFPIIALIYRAKLQYIIWFLLAVFWGIGHQWFLSPSPVMQGDVINHAILEGVVASIPVPSKHKTQFQFQVHHINQLAVSTLVLLDCYRQCPVVYAGEHWRIEAKLKRPHALSNPGGVDRMNWFSVHHIGWHGHIQPGRFQRLADRNGYRLLKLRAQLASRLSQLESNERILGVIQALSLGVTSHMPEAEWALFRRTGTTHLMVISGAHIGLIAMLVFGAIKWLWSRSGLLCLWVPAARVASICALLMAYVYALLAGFGVPAERALIACFFVLIRYVGQVRYSVWQSWRYALMGVLLHEPHSVLMPGFYLSFLAVAILIFLNQRIVWCGFRKMLALQAGCLLGLMPLTLYWFSYGSVNGMLANLVAIPWVSFLIVPMALLVALLCSWCSLAPLEYGLHQAVQGLLIFLTWVDAGSFLNISVSFSNLLQPLLCMLAMAVFLLVPLPLIRWLLLGLVVTVFLPSQPTIKPGEVQIDVLDVGQGLSVVVRTAAHLLIYDTGTQQFHASDMASLVILPYLKHQRMKQADLVVISHPDLDHRGGLATLESHIHVRQLVTDDPGFYHRGLSCHEYPQWTWDNVSFRFFSLPDHTKKRNNRSCVLKIATDGGQMLLTGDIEKIAETYLVDHYGSALFSTVLLVPHHGSKTSSSTLLLKQVLPRFAIVSTGFDNRYHFPHPQAMHRYQQQGIPVYDTQSCGMARVRLGKDAQIRPRCYRSRTYAE